MGVFQVLSTLTRPFERVIIFLMHYVWTLSFAWVLVPLGYGMTLYTFFPVLALLLTYVTLEYTSQAMKRGVYFRNDLALSLPAQLRVKEILKDYHSGKKHAYDFLSWGKLVASWSATVGILFYQFHIIALILYISGFVLYMLYAKLLFTRAQGLPEKGATELLKGTLKVDLASLRTQSRDNTPILFQSLPVYLSPINVLLSGGTSIVFWMLQAIWLDFFSGKIFAKMRMYIAMPLFIISSLFLAFLSFLLIYVVVEGQFFELTGSMGMLYFLFGFPALYLFKKSGSVLVFIYRQSNPTQKIRLLGWFFLTLVMIAALIFFGIVLPIVDNIMSNFSIGGENIPFL